MEEILIPERCAECGEEEYMPYECKFCGQKFCAEHRLPENHNCRGLEEHKQRMKKEGKMFERKELQEPIDSGQGFFEKYLAPFKNNIAYLFLALMVINFLLQETLYSTNPSLARAIYELGVGPGESCIGVILSKPWTLVTSIFSHYDTFHLLFNGIVLFFFGPILEKIIGSKRFFWLFIGAGALAGLGQVVFTDLFLMPEGSFVVLGASGAIFAILGAQTIFTPHMKILLMFIPVELWIATVFLVLANLAFVGGTGVANIAHLIGIGTGVLFGYYYKDKFGGAGTNNQFNLGNTRGGLK